MNRKFAFRLCGELAETGQNLYYGVNTGNLVLTCINAAIELLDMSGSIYSWNAEKKRTQIMKKTLYEAEGKYEHLKEEAKRQADFIVEKEREKSQLRLKALKNELENSRIELEKKIEEYSTKVNYDADIYIKKSKLCAKIRLQLGDTIDIITMQIKKQKLNDEINFKLQSELTEKLRITVSQYNKFINLCC